MPRNWAPFGALEKRRGGRSSIDVPIAGAGIAMKFRVMPPSGEEGVGRPVPERKAGRSRKRGEPGFDRWLTERLHDVFDPVVNEKVPEEFERLLEDFAKRPGGDKK